MLVAVIVDLFKSGADAIYSMYANEKLALKAMEENNLSKDNFEIQNWYVKGLFATP